MEENNSAGAGGEYLTIIYPLFMYYLSSLLFILIFYNIEIEFIVHKFHHFKVRNSVGF